MESNNIHNNCKTNNAINLINLIFEVRNVINKAIIDVLKNKKNMCTFNVLFLMFLRNI